MWNLAAPPGFQGFDPLAPVRIYQRHLPHWRQEGVTYFVTFRLADSLPQEKLNELRGLRDAWQAKQPASPSKEAWEELTRGLMERTERWLDQGMGECALATPEAAAALEETLRHDDGLHYDLSCFIIMPNHVHLLARPYFDVREPLEAICQKWKNHSARKINRLRGESGSLWQQESFDRIVRDEEHLYRCIQYIGRNAQFADLSIDACPRWIRDDWSAAGWGFAPWDGAVLRQSS